MERMKINSKIRYGRSRIKSGYGPHRMLEMIQNLKLGISTDIESKEKDSDSNEKEEASPHHKFTEVKK
jgi:hypothetical protein